MAPTLPTYRSEAFPEDIIDDPAYSSPALLGRPASRVWLGTLAAMGTGLAAVFAWFGLGQSVA